MRRNRLRQLLSEGRPSVGTRLHTTWPGMVEAVGHTGLFDYVEFQAEYGPFDLYALDDFCRAAELHGLGSMIKVDFEARRFVAQRAVGAGFESVLFTDCRTADDARTCISAVRPDTPDDLGAFGAVNRRFSYMRHAGSAEYVQALRDVVVVLMIEKRQTVEALEDILAVPGIDLVQWGPGDYAMSMGWLGEAGSPRTRAVEEQVLRTCARVGVPFRAEANSVDEIQRYLDLGARHFCIGTDIRVWFEWLGRHGEALRSELAAIT